jgi:tRNA pseudouridine38-40 synthase
MARYQLTLAYDGARYEGFQRQRQKDPVGCTVQDVIETCLRQLGWQDRTILAAGRTDSGVHAAGQVVAFDLDWAHTPDELRAALNAGLPEDIAVQTIQLAPPGFHPRYDALARRYRYRIYCQAVRHPLRDRYAWRVWPAVTLQNLNAMAALLPGWHDFAGFGRPPRGFGSTNRQVFKAAWQVEGEEMVFEIVANAFLYHMVRRLVYAQVRIAQQRLPADAIQSRLAGEVTDMVQGLAPPYGLVLVEVIYKQPLEQAPGA